MTPYKQLFKHDPDNGVYGDCARTAIACLLDLHPKSVPHEHRTWADGEQQAFFRAFLRAFDLGTFLIGLSWTPEETMAWMAQANPGIFYMLSGTSRTGCNHVVICKDDRIIHDPSLTNAGIVGPCDDGITYIEMLVKL